MKKIANCLCARMTMGVNSNRRVLKSKQRLVELTEISLYPFRQGGTEDHEKNKWFSPPYVIIQNENTYDIFQGKEFDISEFIGVTYGRI